tara:strand:+ start:271 stop:1215 length:945 start_codon:yes stop_codon:yes gene_type:complete
MLDKIKDDLKYKIRIHNEKKHYSKLLKQQESSDTIQKIEPNIDAFTYAYKLYHPYLLEKMPRYYYKELVEQKIEESNEKINIISLGSGTGAWEVKLVEDFPEMISMELVDINDDLLKISKNYASKNNLDISTTFADINKIKLENNKYDVVIVQSSLHHFLELEHIFEQINESLKDNGNLLVIGEVIGRNGEQIFPETEKIVQQIFSTLPEKFRYNAYTKKIDDKIPEIDFSKDSFESIRSEDIVPLLSQYFQVVEQVSFDAFLSLLLDFRYGPNYDLEQKLDKSLVETITYLDQYYISNSILKPVCLFGIYSKK